MSCSHCSTGRKRRGLVGWLWLAALTALVVFAFLRASP